MTFMMIISAVCVGGFWFIGLYNGKAGLFCKSLISTVSYSEDKSRGVKDHKKAHSEKTQKREQLGIEPV